MTPYFRRVKPEKLFKIVQTALKWQPKVLNFIDNIDIVYVGDNYVMVNMFSDFQKCPVISICLDDFNCYVKTMHPVFEKAFDVGEFLTYWHEGFKESFPKEYLADLEANSIRL